jgi:hypothetical protein
VVKLLLKKRGIDINSRGYHQTPPWCAANGGHEIVIRFSMLMNLVKLVLTFSR